MTATLRIQDGNPFWTSPSIVPSKDTVISSASSPQLAAVQVNSTDVFVYVKVENPGTVDLGACDCTATGAWTAAVAFQGFLANPAGQATDTRFGFTFTAAPGGDLIAGPGLSPQPLGVAHPPQRRAWAWSADGRFFAYVSSATGADYLLVVVALQTVPKPDGTSWPIGGVSSASGTYASPWIAQDFAWADSKAIVMIEPSVSGSLNRDARLLCPYASGAAWTWEGLLQSAGLIDWAALVSPCASFVAFAPRRSMGAPAQTFRLVSTLTAAEMQFRLDNAQIPPVISTGVNPSITTTDHAAEGVTIDTGNGSTVIVDDPECTFEGGGIIVHVDRVKASTLPTANLGVLPIGTAALGRLPQNAFSWVQVPNQNGWANQSERHWCLLAQAYTQQTSATIPSPWNGQAANPPPFPVANENCAQRNIEISP